MTIFKSVFPIFGYHLIFSIIYLDYVRPEAVCLGEDLVMRWDLSLNSDIAYANIKHNANLIAIIDTPNHMIIEDPFKNRIRINVTEKWLVEMTMYSVTYAINGTYKCTIGFIGKPDLIIKKEILVIDPEINILLDTSDNDCKNVKCASNYNVTLIGPNRRKGKENICLSEDDSGIYSCCLCDEYICPSKRCNSIDVRMEDNTNKYRSGNFENTTKEISTTTQGYLLNTYIIIYCTIPVIVIVLCIMLCILFRKKLRDIIRKNTVTETIPSSLYIDVTKSTSWKDNSEDAETAEAKRPNGQSNSMKKYSLSKKLVKQNNRENANQKDEWMTSLREQIDHYHVPVKHNFENGCIELSELSETAALISKNPQSSTKEQRFEKKSMRLAGCAQFKKANSIIKKRNERRRTL